MTTDPENLKEVVQLLLPLPPQVLDQLLGNHMDKKLEDIPNAPEYVIKHFGELTVKQLMNLLGFVPIYYPNTPLCRYVEKTFKKSAVTGTVAGVSAAVCGGIARHSAEQALKEFAEKAAMQGAEQLLKEAGENVLQQGMKEIIQKAAMQGAEKVLKEGGENILQQGMKEFLQKAAMEGAEQVLKEAGENVLQQGTKKFIQKAAKQGAETVFKEVGETALQEGTKEFVEKAAMQGATRGAWQSALGFGLVVEGISFGVSMYCTAKKYERGEVSKEEFRQHAMKRGGGACGSLTGGTIGASIGTVLIPIPFVGTLVGSVVGGVVGDMVGSKAGKVVDKVVFQ